MAYGYQIHASIILSESIHEPALVTLSIAQPQVERLVGVAKRHISDVILPFVLTSSTPTSSALQIKIIKLKECATVNKIKIIIFIYVCKQN